MSGPDRTAEYRAYYLANRERLIAAAHARYQAWTPAQHEAHRARVRRHRQAHRDRLNAQARARRAQAAQAKAAKPPIPLEQQDAIWRARQVRKKLLLKIRNDRRRAS
jgi:hypothetical protein